MNLEALRILTAGATFDGCDSESAAPALGNGYSCEVETGEFLRAIARRLKPALVLLTGCHLGYDSAWIASGLKDNGFYKPALTGRLLTVDINGYQGQPEALWARCGLDNITHLIGNSEDAETYAGRIPGPIHWLHLDADHSAEAVGREFQALLPYLDTGQCLISAHDTKLDERMDAGIEAILADLKRLRSAGRGWACIAHVPLRNLRGLDLIFLSNAPNGAFASNTGTPRRQGKPSCLSL